MVIERQQMEEFHNMVAATRLRPNGLRLQRLLRELPYLDGSLASRFRRVGGILLVTAVLSGAVIVLGIAVVNLPSAQSASVPSATLPAVVDISADVQAASAR